MGCKTASKTLCLPFALGVLLAAPFAGAQGSATDQQLAQSLFEKGRQLMAAGKYAEACPQFKESQRLDPGGGTLLNLAVCHAKEGKTAAAWIEFKEALSLAHKDGRKDREQIAKDGIAEVEPKLSRLRVDVAAESEVPNLVVTLDGVELTRTAWGIDAVVDPGTHRVDALAPGYQKWSAIVILGDTADSKGVAIPKLVPVAEPAVAPAYGGLGMQVAPPSAETLRRYQTHYSPWRYVEGAVTLAALGTSAVTGVLAFTQHQSFTNSCIPDRQFCSSPDGKTAASSARTWAWASTITLGVGVVGAIVFLVWPKEQNGAGPTVGVSPLPGGAGLTVAGSL